MRSTTSMLVLALVLAMIAPAGAQMDLSEDPTTEKVDYDAISMELDLELKMLVFSLGKDGADLVDCTEAAIATEGEAPVTDIEGCHVISIAGPNGQVNHGTIVSSMAHQFGPGKGKLMRHVANSTLGTGDQQVKVENGDDDAAEVEEADDSKPEGWMPPGQAKKQGR